MAPAQDSPVYLQSGNLEKPCPHALAVIRNAGVHQGLAGSGFVMLVLEANLIPPFQKIIPKQVLEF